MSNYFSGGRIRPLPGTSVRAWCPNHGAERNLRKIGLRKFSSGAKLHRGPGHHQEWINRAKRRCKRERVPGLGPRRRAEKAANI
jgi:hypothetical protein